MRVFILGAPDPEMREIEAVLTQKGEIFAYAGLNGIRCFSGNAYSADCLLRTIDNNLVEWTAPHDAAVIAVECGVEGITPNKLLDHHRPGDPGHSMGPERFMDGASLGQLLTYLEMEPTERQRLICAGDHCPSLAYRGLCPGVSPDDLLRHRLAEKAAHRQVEPWRMFLQFERAKRAVDTAECHELWGQQIIWLDSELENQFPLFAEASAYLGRPMMYDTYVTDGRRKVGILGASSEIVSNWMHDCGLREVYGSPARGYAGGYL